MADKYTASPFLKQDPRRPATQGFEGGGAGDQGSMGRLNAGEDHRCAYDAKGTFGTPVKDGLIPSTAQRLIAKSTGINTGNGQNPDLYGKSGKF